MAWFKQLYLLWIILSAAAACVSCQQIISTLREGNRACLGEEVIFTCTIRGPSTLVLGWISDEYIGQGGSLQLSTASVIGDVEEFTGMDGNITATATLTNNTNVNGELVLESTLRITAVEASTVTCIDPNGGQASVEFTISAVPGVPQRINAREISRPLDDICIILVTWDPPANIDSSDIDQYIIYVPSRNIRDVSSSTLTTLTVMNCGDDIHIQVAAVNRVNCVGMNSSEVQLILLYIPAGPTDDGSTTTEGGSTSTSSGLPARVVGGIVGGVLAFFVIFCFIIGCAVIYILWRKEIKKRKKEVAALKSEEDSVRKGADLKSEKEALLEVKSETEALVREMKLEKKALMKERFGSYLGSLYDALKQNNIPLMKEAVHHLLNLEEKVSSGDKKEALNVVFKVKVTSATGIQFALRRLNNMIPKVMSTFDKELKKVDPTVTMSQLIGPIKKKEVGGTLETAKRATLSKKPKEPAIALHKLKNQVECASPKKVQDILHQLFQLLQAEVENLKVEPEKDELHEVFIALGGKLLEAPPETVKTQLQEFIGMLQGPPGGEICEYESINQGPRAPVFSGPVPGETVAVAVQDTNF